MHRARSPRRQARESDDIRDGARARLPEGARLRAVRRIAIDPNLTASTACGVRRRTFARRARRMRGNDARSDIYSLGASPTGCSRQDRVSRRRVERDDRGADPRDIPVPPSLLLSWRFLRARSGDHGVSRERSRRAAAERGQLARLLAAVKLRSGRSAALKRGGVSSSRGARECCMPGEGDGATAPRAA